jgi:hypothetical protein
MKNITIFFGIMIISILMAAMSMAGVVNAAAPDQLIITQSRPEWTLYSGKSSHGEIVAIGQAKSFAEALLGGLSDLSSLLHVADNKNQPSKQVTNMTFGKVRVKYMTKTYTRNTDNKEMSDERVKKLVMQDGQHVLEMESYMKRDADEKIETQFSISQHGYDMQDLISELQAHGVTITRQVYAEDDFWLQLTYTKSIE